MEWIYKVEPLNVSGDMTLSQNELNKASEEGWEVFAIYNHPVMVLRKRSDGSEPPEILPHKEKKSAPSPAQTAHAKPSSPSGPSEAVGLYQKGLSLLSQEKFHEAISEFSKAIDLDSKMSMAYVFRANAFFKINGWEEAIEDFNKALSLKPGDLGCIVNRGICRYQTGETMTAIEDFSKGIEANPQNTIALEYRGQCFRKIKKFDEAISDFSKLIENCKDPHGFLLRGDVKMEIKDFQGALEDYSAAIKCDNQNAMAYFKRSKANKMLDNEEEAKKDMKKYNELFSKNTQAAEVTWGESAKKTPAPQNTGPEKKADDDDFEVVT